MADFGLTKGVWDGNSLYLPIQVSPGALRNFTKKNCDVRFLKDSLSLSNNHIGLP